jgi:hypothetical protein
MKLSASSPPPVKRAALTGIRTSARSHPDIPDDLIRHIYSYLPFGKRESLARTNRRFCDNHLLSYTIDLKHSPVFDYNTAVLCSKPLKCTPIDILRLQGNAQHMKLLPKYIIPRNLPDGAHQEISDLLDASRTMLMMERITILDLDCLAVINDTHIMTIVKTCRVLERLHLNQCDGLITDTAGIAIGQHCPRLVALKMGEAGITATSISEIVRGCPRLEHLSLSGCEEINDHAVSILTKQCPTLISLDLSCSGVKKSRTLMRFLQTHPSLEKIEFPRIDIDSFFIATLLSKCPKLTYLDMTPTDNPIDCASILTLASHGHALRYLSFGITPSPSLFFHPDQIRNFHYLLPACDIRIECWRASGNIINPHLEYYIALLHTEWTYVPHARGAEQVYAYLKELRNPSQFPSLKIAASTYGGFRDLAMNQRGEDAQRFWDAIDSIVRSLTSSEADIWIKNHREVFYHHLQRGIKEKNINRISLPILLDALYLAKIPMDDKTNKREI